MKPNDAFTDSNQRRWVATGALGRGSWGTTWLVRDDAGRNAVLKVPLTADDFAGRTVPEGALDAARQIATEQANILKERPHPFLPVLDATVDLGDGGVGLILPRYPGTLARRIELGAPLQDIVDVLERVARILARTGARHGALRPTNILLDDGGEPVLADIATEGLSAWARRLDAARPDPEDRLPPEIEGRLDDATVDTWSLGLALYSAARSAPAAEGRPLPLRRPERGLDRLELAEIKSAIANRLAAQGSNPRFRGRIAERVSSLLNRALSETAEPTPPYRFRAMEEVATRLTEVASLLDPGIQEIGKLIWGADARDEVFPGDKRVTLSVHVLPGHGLTDPEDIAAGLQLFDLDGDGEARIPLPDVGCDARGQASGRLRFGFDLGQLAPGRYRLHLAFGVKDGTRPLSVVTGNFEVRPPPGWVPPPSDAPLPPAPIPMPQVAQREADPERVADGVAIPFPRPLAPPPDDPVRPAEVMEEPSSPSPAFYDDPHPTPVAPPPASAPPLAQEPWFERPRWEDPPDIQRAPEPSQDLPGFDDEPARREPEWLASARDWFQRDSLTAVGASIAASFVVLLTMLALLRAC